MVYKAVRNPLGARSEARERVLVDGSGPRGPPKPIAETTETSGQGRTSDAGRLDSEIDRG